MSTLLAVETSGTVCSLAIRASGRWFEDTQNVERLHNRVVLASLERLTAAAGISRRSFDAVAFGAGPGSFTGVRIAASVSQGVAFACDAVVVPVSSSLAMAAAVGENPGARHEGRRVLTVTRSRRDAYYLAGFDIGAAQPPLRIAEDRLHLGESPPEGLDDEGWLGAGNRPPWWPASRPFIENVTVTALTIGDIALGLLSRQKGVVPEAGLPVYVTGDSPWRPMGS